MTSSIDERDDGGPDGDTALAFEGEGIGLRAAGIDAADLVDDSGREKQPFGEGGLTCVDVRQDPEVERAPWSVMSFG